MQTDEMLTISSSTYVQNLYWLADAEFLSTFWARLSHLLPQEVAGGKVMGLNARFRGESPPPWYFSLRLTRTWLG